MHVFLMRSLGQFISSFRSGVGLIWAWLVGSMIGVVGLHLFEYIASNFCFSKYMFAVPLDIFYCVFFGGLGKFSCTILSWCSITSVDIVGIIFCPVVTVLCDR